MDKELQRENEIVKNLNIIDDIFFHKMAEDKEFCEEILQTILEDDSLVVVDNEPQKYLRNVGAKSVILDVLCMDAQGRQMNVEVQKADDTDHQRRVRYNASNIDTYYTEKGCSYGEIPDVYVIFISRFDLFRENRTIYHIERRIKETGTVVDNGFYEIYVNTKVDDGSKIAELMQYMKKTEGENENFPKTSKRAKYFKEQQEGGKNMCDAFEQYKKEIMEKAAREAAKEAAKEAAVEFFKNGVDFEIVKKSMKGLSEEELREIYQEVNLMHA